MGTEHADNQPFHVFLCHNSGDKPAVKMVAEQLKDMGLRPWLDEWEIRPGFPWQRSLEAQIRSVKSAAVFVGSSGIGPWQTQELAAFLSEFVERGCPVIPVLLPGCQEKPELPVFLKSMHLVDFNQTDQDYTPIERLIWGITGNKPNKDRHNKVPRPEPENLPPPGLFVGREEPLEKLMDGLKSEGGTTVITGRLFNLEGAGGMGKTTLAREAARRLEDQFPHGVLEITMDTHTPMSLAVELGRKLDILVNEPGNEREARALMSQLLRDKRLLLILDNLIDPTQAPYLIPQHSPSAVMITTRNKDCLTLLKMERRDLTLSGISLERFSPSETLHLFQEVLGEGYRQEGEGIYLEIAKTLGYLPVALRPALNLLVFSPRYSPGQLLEKLRSSELHALLEQGAEKNKDLRTVKAVFDLGQTWLPTPEHRKILEHLACCASGPVPMDFLERFCEDETLQTLLEDLSARSWCQGRDTEQGKVYVMHDLVRDVVRSQYQQDPWDRFVDVVDTAYRKEHFLVKDRWLSQFHEALSLCEQHEDRRQIGWLGGYFHDYCEKRGHGGFYIRLADQAARLFPGDEVLSVVTNQKALILMNWGRLQEAFELLEQSEEIHRRREDKQGLATCYGNQALILRAWGKLEEAHGLHKKEEALKEALGDRAGLSRSYGNQALILRAWGKLEEAHGLLKKQEALCEALGDRAGLAACYGNQAVILQAWGKLEEAHGLLKKQEALKEALGDRAGLAGCYGNQALILRAWGKLEEAHGLHKKQEALCEALGDRAGLSRSYGNQALILSDWGKLEEAHGLHKKQEALKEALGDRAGLATCYWNQGCLLGAQGDLAGKKRLWRKARGIYKALGMPTDFMDGHLAKLNQDSQA